MARSPPMGRWPRAAALEPDAPGRSSPVNFSNSICSGAPIVGEPITAGSIRSGCLPPAGTQEGRAGLQEPGNVVPDQPGTANAGVPVTLLAILKGGQRECGRAGPPALLSSPDAGPAHRQSRLHQWHAASVVTSSPSRAAARAMIDLQTTCARLSRTPQPRFGLCRKNLQPVGERTGTTAAPQHGTVRP